LLCGAYAAGTGRLAARALVPSKPVVRVIHWFRRLAISITSIIRPGLPLRRPPAMVAGRNHGDKTGANMQRGIWPARLALAAGMLWALSAAPAPADECEDIVKAINKRLEALRAARKGDDSRTTICARLGRVSAYTQAIGIVAAECYDEGAERTALMKDAEETEKALEVDNVCR
jgi:hypothetical protein